MEDAEIISRIYNRGYPTDITEAEITEAINTAINHVVEEYPFELYGTFTTVAGQQTYDLFSAGQPLAGGEEVIEIFASGGECADTDVFGIAPFLQHLGYTFDSPSDLALYDMDMAAYTRRFRTVRFRAVSTEHASSIRLIPTPTEAKTLLVKYTMARTAAEVRAEHGEWFLTLVEAFVCRTLAAKFAQVAGVRIGGQADSGKTMQFYQERAEKLLSQVGDMIPHHGIGGAVART